MNSMEYFDISSLNIKQYSTEEALEQLSNLTWKQAMPMRLFRQNFGASVVGLKDERKILVYGYGSGLHQSTSTLGFYPGISPQRVDSK